MFLTSSLRCKIPFMQALLIVCAQNMELPITGLLLSFAIISEESQEFSIDCRNWFKSLSNSIYNYTLALLLSDILNLFGCFWHQQGSNGAEIVSNKEHNIYWHSWADAILGTSRCLELAPADNFYRYMALGRGPRLALSTVETVHICPYSALWTRHGLQLQPRSSTTAASRPP